MTSQTAGSLPQHVRSEQDEQDAGNIGSAAHRLTETTESPLSVAHAERRNRSGGHHREGEPDTEGAHHDKAERHALELQANEKNRERGRTRHQAAGNPEEDDLWRRDGATGKAPLNILRVGAFVSILEIFGFTRQARTLPFPEKNTCRV